MELIMPRQKLNQQTDLSQQIIETAWEQIAENGAAALSLRAIARQLQITAPAIYNYYSRRDDLVTALIIDAYSTLGNAQFDALITIPETNHQERLRAIGLAYRQWAISYPQRYQLIFGTPIPGYHAPEEKTMPSAARSLSALIQVLEDARQAGRWAQIPGTEMPIFLQEQLTNWQAVFPEAHIRSLYLALVVWSRVHGMVSLEIGNQYPSFIHHPELIYSQEIDLLVSYYFRLSSEES